MFESDPRREARARMEQAEKAAQRGLSEADGERDAQGAQAPRRPQRYKLYDRIAGKVSLNTMNIIVAVVALLLLAAIIYGVATGNPQ